MSLYVSFLWENGKFYWSFDFSQQRWLPLRKTNSLLSCVNQTSWFRAKDQCDVAEYSGVSHIKDILSLYVSDRRVIVTLC